MASASLILASASASRLKTRHINLTLNETYKVSVKLLTYFGPMPFKSSSSVKRLIHQPIVGPTALIVSFFVCQVSKLEAMDRDVSYGVGAVECDVTEVDQSPRNVLCTSPALSRQSITRSTRRRTGPFLGILRKLLIVPSQGKYHLTRWKTF